MSQTVIVDATVLLNLLNVPRHNQERKRVLGQFEELKRFEAATRLLLPLAAVFQTGDHIADLRDGNERWRYAGVLRDEVRKALRREAPWAIALPQDPGSIERWLSAFPDFSKGGTGYGLSVLSVVEIWRISRNRIPGQRIRIWSLNARLQNYDPVQ